MPPDPYCSNCGYSLVGLTESSKCPECGRPLVEVLERSRAAIIGRRYRSSIVVFGLPLIDVAQGPHGSERVGRARGIVAIGDVATGWLAIGGFARGLIAFGGSAVGVVAIGGWCAGLLALGGFSVGVAAVGGGALGGLACGGGAVGWIAQAGGAIGYYAEAGGAYAKYALTASRSDPEALSLFRALRQYVGASPQSGFRWFVTLLAWFTVITLFWSLLLSAIVWIRWKTQRPRRPESS